MTDRPELKNWITTGNIITLAAMAVTVGITWGTFTATTNSHAKTLESHSEQLRNIGTIGDMSRRVEDHEARIRVIEDEVRRGMTRIDGRLREIEKAVKQ